MLVGIPPNIQHGHGLEARNSPLPLMIGEWDWDVLMYKDIKVTT